MRADVQSHESTIRCKHGDYRDPNFAKLSKHRKMPSLCRNAFSWHHVVAHGARVRSEVGLNTKIRPQNKTHNKILLHVVEEKVPKTKRRPLCMYVYI